ncbi:MAG: helix-turn-helix domain-containing protein [Planctomycetota bacterium]
MPAQNAAERSAPPTLALDHLLTAGRVAELLDVFGQTVNRMVDTGKLPRPIVVGAGARHRRWRLSDLQNWIRDAR